MLKLGSTRFDDAVEYIEKHVGRMELAAHLRQIVPAGKLRSSIADELSLGEREDDKKSIGHKANTQQRQALRALMLCYRVYMSDIWGAVITNDGKLAPTDFRSAIGQVGGPRWRERFLEFWSVRSESRIGEGIQMFSRTTTNPGQVALAACPLVVGDDVGIGLKLTRDLKPFPYTIMCYTAVVAWLLRSGFVSYRWVWRYGTPIPDPNDAQLGAFRTMFGPGKIVWDGSRSFTANDRLPAVPPGHFIHMYNDCDSRCVGHWMVSLGNGRAVGCNNDNESKAGNNHHVDRIFSDQLSIRNQFLYGYNDQRMNTKTTYKGIMKVFNPSQIPNII